MHRFCGCVAIEPRNHGRRDDRFVIRLGRTGSQCNNSTIPVYLRVGDGTIASQSISAYLLNVGARYVFKDVQWSPAVNANFIWASGGGTSGSNQFRPWFDYTDGYNGYLFAPALTNIQIFNVGASVKPYENTTFSLQGYYYRKADTTPGGSNIASNGNVDFGGLGFKNSGSSHDLGFEVDSIVGHDYSKDVHFQLVYAMFIPLHGFTVFPSDTVAHEVRGEVNVKF